MFIPFKILEEKLKQLLAEDVGQGDVTSAVIVPSDLAVEATVLAKEAGTAAGIEETEILAKSLGLSVETKVADGDEIKKGKTLLKLSGNAQTILSAERTILNLLSRMSGIATATKKLTEKLRKAKATAKIAATRKTALGLSYFDKKAVLIGGGDPHRLRLDEYGCIQHQFAGFPRTCPWHGCLRDGHCDVQVAHPDRVWLRPNRDPVRSCFGVGQLRYATAVCLSGLSDQQQDQGG